jgi:anaerobic ribonucleoside-triphosphate reductase activating protein
MRHQTMLLAEIEGPHVKSAGPGDRTEIFFYGCSLDCPGCINSWRLDDKPYEVLVEDVANQVIALDNPNITIGGGEPTDQPDALRMLLYYLRIRIRKASIILYTGHTIKELKSMLNVWNMFSLVDGFVTGRFVEGQAYEKIERSFIGSRNQKFWIRDHKGVFRPLNIDHTHGFLSESPDTLRKYHLTLGARSIKEG